MAERAIDDLAIVAAHHVDGGTAVAPAFDGAAFNEKVIHTRKLYAVAIALRSHIAHLKISQHNLTRRGIRGTAIIHVEAIRGGFGQNQVVKFHMLGPGEMKTRRPAFENRGFRLIQRGQHDGPVLCPFQLREPQSALIRSRRDLDSRAGLCVCDRGPQFLARADGYSCLRLCFLAIGQRTGNTKAQNDQGSKTHREVKGVGHEFLSRNRAYHFGHLDCPKRACFCSFSPGGRRWPKAG